MLVTTQKELLPWQRVFRDGIAPQLSTTALLALVNALEAKDETIVRGVGCLPKPTPANADETVTAADAACYAIWRGYGVNKVGDLEERFAQLTFECDQLVGEPAGCRYFLNWWDDTELDTTRPQLAALIWSILNSRSPSDTEEFPAPARAH